MRALVILVALAGVAHAEFHAPIPVKSVAATGKAQKDLWKVVVGDGSDWCPAAGDKLTITLAGKPLLDDIAIAVDGSIKGAEVVADGTSFSIEVSDGKVTIPLKTREFTKLVIGVTGQGCVKHVAFGASAAVYTTSDVSTLWADVAAAKAALVACDKKLIAETFAFPFTVTWPDMDQSGMKWPHTKYTSADKLAAGCQNVHIHGAIITLDKEPALSSYEAGNIVVDDGSIRWQFIYEKKHWRVKAFDYAGA